MEIEEEKKERKKGAEMEGGMLLSFEEKKD